MKSELIKTYHINRKAVIYIRQSTPNQVLSHQESLKLQYALKQKAIEFGWREEDIEIIDTDLGLSGKECKNREGFKEMLAKVTLGEVGIILSYEVTRLCRNCSDWYPLLDICGYKGCLIADADGIYDPSTANGRLILGLKGQLSELELHTIKMRLLAGLMNKAQRGELALKLPAGLIRNEKKEVHKHPDLRVQHSIKLVFDTFLELGSGNKVMHFLRKNDLSIPRSNYYGEIVWKKPSLAAVLEILNNPAYAGAFAYGKTKKTYVQGGKFHQKRVAMPEWKILIQDQYPAYISWQTYEKIQAQLADNYAQYDINKTRGIPRQGLAMLAGIVYCGQCGHKMVVQYKGTPYYLCNRNRRTHGAKVCQYISTQPVDREVTECFFKAVSPIELDIYEKAIERQRQMEEKIELAQKQKIENLQYRAHLAQRQFDKADPENRLVTAELERRWEQTLQEVKQAQESYEKYKRNKKETPQLSSELKEIFSSIGKRLPEIWGREEILPTPKKKALLRTLIDKVVIYRKTADQINARIIWMGGESTIFEIPVTVHSVKKLSSWQNMEQKIIEISTQNKSNQEIADILTGMGYRSPRAHRVLSSTVAEVRRQNGVSRQRPYAFYVQGFLTISQLSGILSLSSHWFHDRIRKGIIKTMRGKKNIHIFPDTPATLEKFKKLIDGEITKIDFNEE